MSSETPSATAATEAMAVTEATADTAAEKMELESAKPEVGEERENVVKRDREEDAQNENEIENGAVSKKLKVEDSGNEKSVEEVKMEKLVEEEEKGRENVGPVSLGPKTFGNSVEMFDYFYKFLHRWPINFRANKYEHLVLLDLIMKGHPEPEKKIGSGVTAFEIRYHPMWQSRCFFVVRDDKTVEDFSFRKCVDHILPLPENMKIKSDVNKVLGGNGSGKKSGGGGRGGGRGRGRGKGGRSRR